MTATGTPRTLIEDDTYGDYKFEKGTIFSYNNFGICHNENEFTRNEEFVPERFLDDDLQDMLKGHLGFGAGRAFSINNVTCIGLTCSFTGRRICPGWHLGTRNMFIAFSRLLYCFNFKEVSGAPINDGEIDPLAHDHPPFQIEIVPRSHDHIGLIERECAEAGHAV